MNVFEETLTKILKNSIEAMGYELYDLTYSKGPKKGKLTVYIDKAGGVSLNDCEVVSKHISVVLDVENIINESYILEVSSPGINRNLKTKKHYEDSIGKECLIHLFNPIDNQKNISGKIINVFDDGVEIQSGQSKIYIDYRDIKKAKLNLI
ncbi:ribosome maturation factor RimP [Desulfurella sp.]|uniref:ribosome maturation factor RimP n=1 Tax=Desulfurella sp. TaxID=1962857 RepID=UPI0025C19544|nr:ribosome maturation factor RimP [Desulfurella sp.]